MSFEGLIVVGILAVIVAVIVVSPFISRPRKAVSEDPRREQIDAYYARVLAHLRDLDEDHALGKIAEDDYAADRALWTERGIQALKARDSLDAESLQDSTDEGLTLDDRIEAAVRRARGENV